METLGVVLEPSALKWNSSKQIYKLDIRIINTSPKPRVISIQKPIDSEVSINHQQLLLYNLTYEYFNSNKY